MGNETQTKPQEHTVALLKIDGEETQIPAVVMLDSIQYRLVASNPPAPTDGLYMAIAEENDDGVLTIKENKKISLPICIVGRSRRECLNQKTPYIDYSYLVKVFTDGRQWVTYNAPFCALDDRKNSTLLNSLNNLGWRTYTGKDKTRDNVLQYLNLLANLTCTDYFTLINFTGWKDFNDKTLFVGSSKNFTGGEPDFSKLIFDGDTKNLLNSNGTVSEWQERIGRYVPYSKRAILAVCSVFTAPMLNLRESLRNFGFHFHGASSSGKSTSLYIAQSVIGRTTTGKLYTWNSTLTNVEAFFRNRNDLPSILDEMGQLQAKGNLESIFYLLGNGTGKGRSDKKIKETERANFRTILLSTGEKSTNEFYKSSSKYQEGLTTGALLRVMQIPAIASRENGVFDSIPPEFKDGRTLSEYLTEESKKTYGAPFEVFLNALVECINENGKEELSKILDDLREQFIGEFTTDEDDSETRVTAGNFGFVAGVGELISGGYDGYLTRYIPRVTGETVESFTGWKHNTETETGTAWNACAECFKLWRENFKEIGNEDKKFIDRFVAFLLTNPASFPFKDQSFTGGIINHLGWRQNEPKEFYVRSEVFRASKDLLQGMAPSTALKILEANGILVKDKDQRKKDKRRTQKVYIESEKRNINVYTFRIPDMEESETEN